MSTMSSNKGSSKGGLSTLLQNGGGIRLRIEELADKFVKGPSSPIPSIHPALQLPATPLFGALVPKKVIAAEPAKSDALVPVSPAGARAVGEENAVASRQETYDSNKDTNNTAVNSEVNDEESSFIEAMREYEATASDKYKTWINPDEQHTMAQLWTVVDDAIAEYNLENKKKRVWSRIRLAFRKLGDGSEAINGWLGLLPQESKYLSVVCGGLKLIIKAAARMRNVATKVLDGLHQIPAILSGAQRVLNIFKGEEELQKQSKILYTSILVALGHMLDYLKRNSFPKAIKAVFNQDIFESSLVEKIDNIAKERDAFNEQAKMCHWEAMKKMKETSGKSTEDLKNEINNIYGILKAYEIERQRANGAIVQALKLVSMSYEELRKELDDMITTRLEKPLKEMMKLLTASPMALDYAYTMNKRLDAPGEPFQRIKERRGSIISISKGKRTAISSGQHRRNLLSQLDYDPDSAGNDIATNYILGSTLSRDDQERSLYVTKSKVLADWVMAKGSAVLLINGNAKRVERKSALSFVCARLVYALDQIRAPPANGKAGGGRQDIVTLHFFCGQHDTGGEPWESPAGIANSLLAQLLTQCRDLDVSPVASMGGDLDNGSVKNVFSWFKIVVQLLPAETTVFCVIDGISFYVDNYETERDAKWLVKRLLRLTKKMSPRKYPNFRLLLTAPAWLHMTDVKLEDGEILNVKSVLPNTGGFSAMKWDLAVGRRLGKLAESDE